MGIFAYIVIGLLAGAIARRLGKTQKQQDGIWSTTFLGIIGSVAAGGLWNVVVEQDPTLPVALSSIIAATLGASITLGMVRLIRK